MHKSRYELELIKEKWLLDPSWDIENTEGFEEYKPELIAFSEKHNADWKLEHEIKVRDFAKQKGVNAENNYTFAKFIYALEQRITRLEIENQHLRDKL